MSVRIHVDGYSGWKANERPMGFELDGVAYRISAIEDQWYEPEAQYFKVRAGGKTYLLRYDQEDEWTLQGGFDGDELLARPHLTLFPVNKEKVRQAEALFESCEYCQPNDAVVSFDVLVAEVTRVQGLFEFILEEPARCPNCEQPVTDKTRVHRR